MTDRVDKSWQDKGLSAYPVEALLGTLGHYGVAIDEAGFRALAKEHFPIAIGAGWASAWKGTGKFKDFPFPAADELWRRWLKDTLAPNDLVLCLLKLLQALGLVSGTQAAPEVDAAFQAAEATQVRVPAEGNARDRFMSEVVTAMGKLVEAMDTGAERLAREGKLELAQRFVALEEALFPVRAGVSRAIVDAVLGKKDQAVAALETLANDEQKDAFGRLSAYDALVHLGEGQRGTACLFALMKVAGAEHDHDLAAACAQRGQTLVKGLPRGPEREVALQATAALIDAFDHHH